MPSEVAGEIEIVCEFDDDNAKMPQRDDEDEIEIGPSKTPPKKGKKGKGEPKAKRQKKERATFQPKWSKAKNITFSRQSVNIENEKNRGAT